MYIILVCKKLHYSDRRSRHSFIRSLFFSVAFCHTHFSSSTPLVSSPSLSYPNISLVIEGREVGVDAEAFAKTGNCEEVLHVPSEWKSSKSRICNE